MKIYKLIKLQDKFILVNNEKIKEGDNRINIQRGYLQVADKEGLEYYNKRNDVFKKVISETPDFSLLSEEDCKEIGFIDVDKLAIEETIRNEYNSEISFKQGFRKAQSLNDKMFSLKDIKKAYFQGEYDSQSEGSYPDKENKFIQSLQQTSWDVEVNELNQITKIL